jgi:hypothetical protein
MTPLDRAISQLHDVLRDYDRIDNHMATLVHGWQLLDPEARRMVGGLAPEMIDAVLKIEHYARRMADAS